MAAPIIRGESKRDFSKIAFGGSTKPVRTSSTAFPRQGPRGPRPNHKPGDFSDRFIKDLVAQVNPKTYYEAGRAIVKNPVGVAKAMPGALYESVRHPLRHPGDTATLLASAGFLAPGVAAKTGVVRAGLKSVKSAGKRLAREQRGSLDFFAEPGPKPLRADGIPYGQSDLERWRGYLKDQWPDQGQGFYKGGELSAMYSSLREALGNNHADSLIEDLNNSRKAQGRHGITEVDPKTHTYHDPIQRTEASALMRLAGHLMNLWKDETGTLSLGGFAQKPLRSFPEGHKPQRLDLAVDHPTDRVDFIDHQRVYGDNRWQRHLAEQMSRDLDRAISKNLPTDPASLDQIPFWAMTRGQALMHSPTQFHGFVGGYKSSGRFEKGTGRPLWEASGAKRKPISGQARPQQGFHMGTLKSAVDRLGALQNQQLMRNPIVDPVQLFMDRSKVPTYDAAAAKWANDGLMRVEGRMYGHMNNDPIELPIFSDNAANRAPYEFIQASAKKLAPQLGFDYSKEARLTGRMTRQNFDKNRAFWDAVGYGTSPHSPGPHAWDVFPYKNVAEDAGSISTVVFRPDRAISHRQAVERALMHGKPVPPEVLDEYPALKRRYEMAQQKGRPFSVRKEYPRPKPADLVPTSPDLLKALKEHQGISDTPPAGNTAAKYMQKKGVTTIPLIGPPPGLNIPISRVKKMIKHGDGSIEDMKDALAWGKITDPADVSAWLEKKAEIGHGKAWLDYAEQELSKYVEQISSANPSFGKKTHYEKLIDTYVNNVPSSAHLPMPSYSTLKKFEEHLTELKGIVTAGEVASSKAKVQKLVNTLAWYADKYDLTLPNLTANKR